MTFLLDALDLVTDEPSYAPQCHVLWAEGRADENRLVT
jgi:hypothetical protein